MSSEGTTLSRQRLAELMETIDASQNPEHEILKHLIASVSEKDAELGNAIRYCAIPRRFDARIIGVLRDAPDDREANESLLAKLMNFSFVRTRPDGGYTYHDGTRDILLEQWRAGGNAAFERLNQQLINFYKGQYDKVERLEGDLYSVARVMQSANPARYYQLASICETLLVAPLLECLYHKSLQSAEACYRYFEELFQEQEQVGHVTVRESLLNATRDYLERLPPGSGREPWLKWLQYWKGRLKLTVRQDKKAVEILLELLPQAGDDIVLKLWVLGDLGRAYYNQNEFRQARDYYRQAISLAEETGKDPYNLPVSYFWAAQLHWTIEELEEASENYREAIKYAQGSKTQEPNIGIQVAARIDLGGVLYDRGDWESALNETVEAFHLARTRLPSDKGTYQSVIQRLMNLLARRDPRLLDTVFLEAEASFANSNDPLVPLRFRQRYVSLMWQSGQLRRGDEELTKLMDSARKQQNSLFYCDLLLEQARLREDQGRLESVVTLYDELAERAAREGSGKWDYAAAVTNRGMIRCKLGLWKQAEADLQEAIEKWREMSHEKLESFMHGALATTLRQQGRLQQAQESLDKAFVVLKGTHSKYLNVLFQEQGEIYQAQGRREEARREYQHAFERYLRLDQFKDAARSLGSLTTLASDCGDWVEAARCSSEANKLWQRLAEIDAYSPSDAQKLADEKNAVGAQAVFGTDDDRLEKIREARELFRDASEKVPENFWYRLNLAYACADLEEWEAAAQAIADMLTCSHKWLRTRILYERLADFRARQGEKLFGGGQYEEAARFYAESRTQLEGKVAFERLAEVDLKRGDSFLKLAAAGRLGDAQEAFEQGLSRAEEEGKKPASPETGGGDSPQAVLIQATFHARLGLLKALQAALPEALEHFRASIGLRAGLKQSDVVEDVVGTINQFSDAISSVRQYRVVGEALRTLAVDRSIDDTQRRLLFDALLDFSRSRYRVTRRPAGEAAGGTASNDFLPIPILLEADAHLFPLGEYSPEVIRMIQVDIPTMRQEKLYKPMGVLVPGVRMRASDDLTGGQYVLSLNEVQCAKGVVFAGEKFCPDAARCLELGIEGRAALDPEGQKEGAWLKESAWGEAERGGLQLLDSYQYMILHLGILLRRNLADFMGVQETRDMLDRLIEEETDRRTLVEKAVPDDAALVQLTHVLQQLLREGVPVRNLSNILTAFAEVNPTSELIDVIESVRAALREELPVNNGASRLIGLSEDFEAAVGRWVRQQGGKRSLAMPDDEAIQLVNALRRRLGNQAVDGLAIIVSTPGLRPFVWRLVKEFYPSLPVSSPSELADGTAPPDERVELTFA